ncbi:MAG: (P)ppGpp synthetase I, SpoT/RelA [Parcubacteria group bacterium GW2011_GWA2_40_8]|nr:MAG: (P)ppGpp synthetase I, SpoT/RelA [Parcubacteria group bacterium GW2011_GWB1_40_14]KKR78988.1 MAG: (P)ppGpp synthetase I, SpoT/RelA [Parcubacteria group bacterium GW2011_GWA2_40_8]
MESLHGSEVFLQKLKHKVTPKEIELIRRAYEQAKSGHRGQPRDGGERYFEHPKGTALILIDELHIYDSEMIIAALLHDIVEDTWLLSPKAIHDFFGDRVAYLVGMVTKKENATPEEKQSYLDNIAGAGEDVRIIKLADRLHNMRSIETCTREKQLRQLQETKTFFMPLAWKTNAYLAQELEEVCEKTELRLSQNP